MQILIEAVRLVTLVLRLFPSHLFNLGREVVLPALLLDLLFPVLAAAAAAAAEPLPKLAARLMGELFGSEYHPGEWVDLNAAADPLIPPNSGSKLAIRPRTACGFSTTSRSRRSRCSSMRT